MQAATMQMTYTYMQQNTYKNLFTALHHGEPRRLSLISLAVSGKGLTRKNLH